MFSVAGWKWGAFTFQCVGTRSEKWISRFIKTEVTPSSVFESPSLIHLNKEFAFHAGPWNKSLHRGLSPVPPPKCVSSQKWAGCQTPRGRLDPCVSGFEGCYSSRNYTMSVPCLAFQFPGVVLLNIGSKALLNAVAQSAPSAKFPFQFSFNALDFPLVHCRGWIFHSQETSHILLLNSCFQRPTILPPTEDWK